MRNALPLNTTLQNLHITSACTFLSSSILLLLFVFLLVTGEKRSTVVCCSTDRVGATTSALLYRTFPNLILTYDFKFLLLHFTRTKNH